MDGCGRFALGFGSGGVVFCFWCARSAILVETKIILMQSLERLDRMSTLTSRSVQE